jgi:hypothetical protein
MCLLMLQTRLLDNGSNLTLWAQARQADRRLQSHPLLNGLKVQDQQQYPTPEAVCAQVSNLFKFAQQLSSPMWRSNCCWKRQPFPNHHAWRQASHYNLPNNRKA